MRLSLIASLIVVMTSLLPQGQKAFASSPTEELAHYEFPPTGLNITLMATVTRMGISSAMIRDNYSGKIKSYNEGDRIDMLGSTETATIVKIAYCSLILKRGEVYESLACRINLNPALIMADPDHGGGGYSPLARFRVVDDYFDKPPVFKSVLDKEIKAVSRRHGVDPYLVKAIIKAESDFDPGAVSPKKAMGIMQLTPETASDYGVKNPFDPIENLDGGVRVLRDLMDYFYGNRRLALAAYNAGRWAVVKSGFKVPPYKETREFVDKVMNFYSFVDFDERP
jgi:hypothetical protein